MIDATHTPSLPHRTLAGALRRVGKAYTPAPDLPLGLIFDVMCTRLFWLVRGMLRFRRNVFVGPRVKVRGKRHIRLGSGCTLENGVILDGYAHRGLQIGARTKLGAHSIISCTSHLSLVGEGFSIGEDSGIGEYAFIGAAGGVTIGSNVIMGQFVTFHSQEHNYGDATKLIRDQGTSQQGITIGDDCWVGARVTFLDGVHISEGCVVAAGAVVRDTFPPFCVIAGVPARIVSNRKNGSKAKHESI
jgi:acetyltransferase-like isoleucine patch superfamily enzyme